MLKQKIKNTLIQYYSQQDNIDYRLLGRAIDWRFRLIDNLLPLVQRDHIAEDTLINWVSGFCIIQRQVEAELDLYQQELQNLALELENEDIDQSDFEERLENMTIAILILAFLAGSEIADNELSINALAILNSGGVDDTDLDLSNLPEQAQTNLNSEIAVALGASAGLAEAISSGEFEDRQEALFSRLTMWATTALGIVSLGKLFLDAATFQIWLYSPLKQHCDDCAGLNGQVHTVLEWHDFFASTSKRPQSRSLLCKGFNCGCGFFNANGPSVGNFV